VLASVVQGDAVNCNNYPLVTTCFYIELILPQENVPIAFVGPNRGGSSQ